jgi:hypothetical protein
MNVIVFFVFFLFFTIILDSINIVIHGKPIDDDLVLKWIKKVKSDKGFRINPYNKTVITDSSGVFFTRLSLCVLFKYYVEGVGVVWRWSKGAQALDQVCDELEDKYGINSQRRRLGL